MALQNLEVDLDLKQNLNIYATCKQLDNLTLICNIYDNSVQADLTNYNVKLRAMKADKVPLIQDTSITILNNVATIAAHEQLTTTSGKTLIELQFIDKTTGLKKATFNLVLVVVPSTLEVNASISTATYTLLQELENKLDQCSDFLENIDTAIIANNTLENTISSANIAKTNLDNSISDGDTLKNDLDNTISTGDTLKSDLEQDISTGNALKTNLESDISTGEELLNSLETFEQEHADVSNISIELSNLSEQMSDIPNQAYITEKAKTVDVNNALALKADKTYVDNKTQANNLAYKESYDTLALLQSAYPTGDTYNHAVLADGYIYTYVNSAWTSTKVQANGSGIANNSVTEKKTNLFDDISIVDEVNFISGGVWLDGVLSTSFPTWSYIADAITLDANTSYSINGVTDYHIDLLDSSGNLVKHIAYGSSNGFEFTTTATEVKMHISILSADVESFSFVLSDNSSFNKYQLKDKYLGQYTQYIKNTIEDSINKNGSESFFINVDDSIITKDNVFSISGLRFGSKIGEFADLVGTFSCDITTNFDYIVAEISGLTSTSAGTITLTKGTKTYYWKDINNLSDNQYILCYSNDGIWYSHFSPIESELRKNDNIVKIEKIVKQGGTIGTDCDYTDIQTALNSITDNSYYKRYELRVLDGTYDYSDNGDNIGVYLKNYITINGVDKSRVIIKKIETTFAWEKATVDLYKGVNIEYTSIRNCTIISNNCKCPLHVDSTKLTGTFEGINLDLINLQPSGSGDYLNCCAIGFANKNSHFILKNVRANGKLWAHNTNDTESEGIIEFLNCSSKILQFGDLTSYGKDKIVVKGCKADLFEHLWFSEYTGSKSYQCPSFEFELEGNSITRSRVADHAGTHDALTEYFGGKYPFTLNEIHTYCYSTENIVVGDLVYKKDFTNMFEVTKTSGTTLVGKAVENISNGMVLVEKVSA